MVVKIKKVKGTKKCVQKEKLKFENHKNCLKATQLDNEINYLEKHKTNAGSLKRDHEELIKNNELILKTQQKFKSEKHSVFTEKN